MTDSQPSTTPLAENRALSRRDAPVEPNADPRLLQLARFIVRFGFPTDWACARCAPGSDLLVAGFCCVGHLAADIVAASGQPGGDGGQSDATRLSDTRTMDLFGVEHQ